MSHRRGVDTGFSKADSNNLPAVDNDMILSFFKRNTDFLSAEVKNVKTDRSGREKYGDVAIGFVQVQRTGQRCLVKGKITPEFALSHSDYDVLAEIDEGEEEVLSCKCLSCKGSASGCKHGVAFLMWLHRRSEEPSVTSTVCYWRKSPLATMGKNINNMQLKYLCDKEVPLLEEPNVPFLNSVVKDVKGEGGVFEFYAEIKFHHLALHHLALKYQAERQDQGADDFIDFMKQYMTDDECQQVERATKNQSTNDLWYEMRYGRITASRIYEASKCSTMDGALTEVILEATKPLDTEPVKRGIRLEENVRQAVAQKLNIKIKKQGIFLDPKFPVFGASPDGLSEDYVFECKCPFKEKTISNYIVDGKLKPKYEAQVQLQMLFTKKTKALFCVASPTFEEDNEVIIQAVAYDEMKCKEYMRGALDFWKKAIYPKVV